MGCLERVAYLCEYCEWWRDVPAYPELGDRCGSARVCAIGRVTYAGRWDVCFKPLGASAAIERAQSHGRLF